MDSRRLGLRELLDGRSSRIHGLLEQPDLVIPVLVAQVLQLTHTHVEPGLSDVLIPRIRDSHRFTEADARIPDSKDGRGWRNTSGKGNSIITRFLDQIVVVYLLITVRV